MNINYFMNEAIKEAKLAFNNNEVPVGGVLIDNKTKPSDEFYTLANAKKLDFVDSNQREPNTSEVKFIYSATFGEMANF